jgi:hypothetical protein
VTAPRPAAWAGVAAAAATAGALIPSGPPGTGMALTGVAIAAAVAYARPRPLAWESAGWAGAALVFVVLSALRDAPWLLLVDVAAAAGCSALAVAGVTTWAGVVKAPFRVAAEAMHIPAAVAHVLPGAGSLRWIGPTARAAGGSVVLLVVFGALFASADAAFARIATDVLVPDVDVGLVPARVIVAVVVAAGTGGLILAGTRRADQTWPEDAAPVAQVRRSAVEWAVPLALLDALFLSFVVVQAAVLFGGHDHVLQTTGLTYAEYARAGFFQLVVIAALVLAVIAAASRVAGGSGRDRLLKGLLGLLCLLTLVVLASALRRMDLYEDAYGLTRIRVSVYAVDLWLAGIFVLVMLAGLARRAPWLPRAAVALSVVSLLAFNVANPEALIARSGVERWRDTGELDVAYLQTLSADGVPALMGLPPEVRTCVTGPIEARLGRREPWSSYNLSRAAARDVLAEEETPCTLP